MILNFSFVTIMIDPVENLSAFFPERSRRDVAYQHPDDVVQAAAQPRRVHSREERAGRFIHVRQSLNFDSSVALKIQLFNLCCKALCGAHQIGSNGL